MPDAVFSPSIRPRPCAIEGRISRVVDIPKTCCSLHLPTAIVDFDIRPSASGPVRADRGNRAVSS